jgi:hypothetical protein
MDRIHRTARKLWQNPDYFVYKASRLELQPTSARFSMPSFLQFDLNPVIRL